jgi:type IV secretion system protein TrbL
MDGTLDAGLIDLILNLMNGSIALGLSALFPLMFLFLGLSTLAAITMTMLVVLHEASLATLWMLMKIFFGQAIVTVIMLNWQVYTMVLLDTSILAGLAIAGHQMSVDDFLHPGKLAARGAGITQPMNTYLNKLGYTAVYKPHLVAMMSICTMIIAVMWVSIAVLAMFGIFGFKILVLISAVTLGFLVAQSTRWVGMQGIRLMVAAGMGMFTLASWISIVSLVIPEIIDRLNVNVGMWSIVILAAVTFAFLLATIILPMIGGVAGFSMAGMVQAKAAARAAGRVAA